MLIRTADTVAAATTTVTVASTAIDAAVPTSVNVIDKSVIGTTSDSVPVLLLTVYIPLVEATLPIRPLSETDDQTF